MNTPHDRQIVHSSESTNWNTPAILLEWIEAAFGQIGLDPCGGAGSLVDAQHAIFTEKENGLEQSWRGYGLTYCNPPYGRVLPAWADKACEEFELFDFEADTRRRVVISLPFPHRHAVVSTVD